MKKKILKYKKFSLKVSVFGEHSSGLTVLRGVFEKIGGHC
jgi:hypothetical protein